jgi:hypothetical protein
LRTGRCIILTTCCQSSGTLPRQGLKKKIFYRYNNKKQLVLKEEYPQDSLLPVKQYSYDASGSLTEVYWKRRDKSDDTVTYHETYQYDTEGRLASREEKNARRGKIITTVWKYTYEKKNADTKVTETCFINGKKKKKVKYEVYNDKGLIVYTRDGFHMAEYTYEYNPAGDWIVQKVCVKNGDIGTWRCEGEFRRVQK